MPLSRMSQAFAITLVVLPFAASVMWYLHQHFMDNGKRKIKPEFPPETPNIYIVEKWSDWENVAPKFIPSCEKDLVIGLDCEWTSNTGRVSLLQLASLNEMCVLIRLCKFQPPYDIPKSLQDLLANQKILKVGVNIHLDVSKLCKNYNIAVNSHLDLACLAYDVTHNNISSCGLKGLAYRFLGVTLDKSFEIVRSNWDAPTLSQAQVTYAATDALVSVQLFYNMVDATLSSEEKIKWRDSKTVPWSNADSTFRRFANRSYSASTFQRIRDNEKLNHFGSGKSKRKLVSAARKSPLYDNNVLQAPDGQELCKCSTRKANWYMEQSLADLISEDPMVVRLRFEPGGRPTSQDDYYLQNKENICVVCGVSDSVVRKNVIPNEYRRHFPNELKDHQSHDVVLLCLACHQFSDLQDTIFKQELAKRFNAPLDDGDNTRIRENSELKRIRSAARALENAAIPDSRRKELVETVCNHFNVNELTQDILKVALNMNIRVENSRYIQHGYRVVEQAAKGEGLIAFEQMWRQHFLTANSPKHLPKMWSIEHKH